MRGLHNLVKVVVEIRGEYRRTGRRAEAEQATFPQRTALWIIVAGSVSAIVTPLTAAARIDARPRTLVWMLLPAASAGVIAYGLLTL